ncbi:dockerin type I domain-containing protein, partial [Ruminococcus sp.]
VSNRLYGDSNLDGEVDLSDAILIMQSLANPDKYGKTGSDKKHLTQEGSLNGDVDGEKGLTSNDALTIQMKLLGFYNKLPIA